ncbi:MAG: ATP-binding protein [Victivallaceae bacterium]|nr:ATP-binding protein [Victivallaceae bacterium]
MTNYIIGALVVAVAVILIQMTVIVHMRRALRLNRELLSVLPLRFLVTDRKQRRLASGLSGFPGADGADLLSRCRAVIHSGGRDGADSGVGEMIRLLGDGKLAAWISLDPDFRQGRAESEHAKRRFRVFDAMKEGAVFVDQDGRVVDSNNAFGRLTGYYPSELAGKPVENILRFVDERRWNWRLQSACEFDGELVARGGDIVPVRCRVVPVRRGGETMVLLADRGAEHALRKELELDEKVLEMISSWCDLSYFCYSPSQGRVTAIGKRLGELWAFNGKFPVQPEEWICSADLPEFMRLRNGLCTGAIDKAECVFRSDYFDDLRHYRMRCAVSVGRDGERIVFGLLRNETNTGRRERELRDANELIQAFLDAAPVPLFVKEVTGGLRYTVCNREFCREFDLDMEKVIGGLDSELFDAAAADAYMLSDREADRSDRVVQSVSRVRRGEGNERVYQLYKKAFNLSGGKRMIAGAALDVTEADAARTREAEQRELLKRVLDYMPAFVAAKDASNDFRYTLWNRTAERLSGCTAAEVLGRTDFEIEKLSKVAAMLRREDESTLSDGGREAVRHMHWSEESPQTLQTRSLPVAVDRNSTWVLIMGLDVTEREEMAREREKLIRDLDGHIMAERVINQCLRGISSEFDFERAMREMLRVIGETTGADRCHIHEFSQDGEYCNLMFEWVRPGVALPAGDGVNVPKVKFAAMAEVLRQERFIRVADVGRLSAVQGGIRTAMKTRGIKSVLHVGIFTGDQLTGVIGIDSKSGVADIGDRSLDILWDAVSLYRLAGERKQRLDEIDKSRELLAGAARQAEKAAEEKSMFLATMSHELRTPLNAVIGFAELLEPGCADPVVTMESVRAIKLAGTTLLNLINDILDLAKLESGKMQLRAVPTSIPLMIEEIMTMFEVGLKEKRLSGKTDIADIPSSIYLDGSRLRQILLNLVGNAVKFTDAGGVAVSCRFRESGPETGTLTVEVADTGIGIAADELDTIFNPFEQSVSTTGQGTGLGLPICRLLAGQMGGTLKASSRVDCGSVFVLELPDLRFSRELEPDTEPEFCGMPAAGIRVLAVDDQEVNRRLLHGLCTRLKLDVRTAESGARALEILKTFNAEAVLTDLRMPDMTGDELARRIRRLPGGANIKLAMVTADVDAPGSEAAGGFDAVLVKPVTLAKLGAFFSGVRGGERIDPCIGK